MATLLFYQNAPNTRVLPSILFSFALAFAHYFFSPSLCFCFCYWPCPVCCRLNPLKREGTHEEKVSVFLPPNLSINHY
jgi:hypothetical protein